MEEEPPDDEVPESHGDDVVLGGGIFVAGACLLASLLLPRSDLEGSGICCFAMPLLFILPTIFLAGASRRPRRQAHWGTVTIALLLASMIVCVRCR